MFWTFLTGRWGSANRSSGEQLNIATTECATRTITLGASPILEAIHLSVKSPTPSLADTLLWRHYAREKRPHRSRCARAVDAGCANAAIGSGGPARSTAFSDVTHGAAAPAPGPGRRVRRGRGVGKAQAQRISLARVMQYGGLARSRRAAAGRARYGCVARRGADGDRWFESREASWCPVHRPLTG